MKKVLFIINPIAGSEKNIQNLEKLIKKNIDKNKFELIIEYTKYALHATEIAKQAVENKIEIVVAVGGDGTVNEISKSLNNTDTSLAIIPKGSGNGLARSLGISMNTKKAVKLINSFNISEIDTIKINDSAFVNVAGIGFDAHISHLFADFGKRGFFSYLKLVFKEFFSYKSAEYFVKTENQELKVNAFLISLANSSQFGNEAHIAPLAKVNDGLIDICILEKFPIWKAFFIGIMLYNKQLHKCKYYKLIK
ncbi:MAG: YegS/Rv2252/BmrU family lipid kinase, partial [Bacteroidales bacterium]|nr:YegS/Rv2252/BmrU family lipid kinase [Bacteroidales bacterium]